MDLYPTGDASVVAKLNDAGAVILGKSSMSELAFGLYDTQNSVIDGYTRNPYHLDYASGGSSRGTGVAVAAGMCVAGLGTDTGCSVRAPSSVNGIVGLRPTHGLVDYAGIMPLNSEWDTVGPMARSVVDVAIVLDVIGGRRRPNRHGAGLDHGGLSDTRVGALRNLAMPEVSAAEVVALFDQALVDLESAGADVIDPVETDVFVVQFDGSDWEMRFRHDFDEFLASSGRQTSVHSLADVAATRLVSARYADDVQEKVDWSFEPDHHPNRAKMNQVAAQYRAGLLDLMEDRALDALVFPTFRHPPVLNGSNPSSERIGSNNAYASLTGFPALNVPMGLVEPGLPMGLQIMGRPHSEERLLKIGFGYERHTQHFEPPTFSKT
jgi:Asp-tRNA(Asn)/Glu-tRNA(Gln) amidotransferase A subunit family amidase